MRSRLRTIFFAVVCIFVVFRLYSVLRNNEPAISSSANIKENNEKGTLILQPMTSPLSLEKEKADAFVAAVLVISCNRPAVKRCLDVLLKYRTSSQHFPVIVSQDCGHQETSDVIASYGETVKHIKQPDLSDVKVPQNMVNLQGYYKLSRHYKWALGQVFDVMKYDYVIIVEDDIEIAPDFFEYFMATIPLLDNDSTLWCVSAWNDNGKVGFVKGNNLLYRSDFFPGLGWALKRSLWRELKSTWPAAFWDDWMRHPKQRKDRSCIRPEIPRTKTFGRLGVSNGQFYDKHLKNIQLNSDFYPFTKKNMAYLLKENYDPAFEQTVYNSPLVSVDNLIQGKVTSPSARIEYGSSGTFITIANDFNIMTDLKAGIPRMGYKGVVSFMYEGVRVYLAPPKDWEGYEEYKGH